MPNPHDEMDHEGTRAMGRRKSTRVIGHQAGRAARQETGPELVERIVNGDAQAFAELHARYRPRVNAFALRRLPNPADAEDITQEVFLQVHRSVHSFQGRSNLSTWIFGIAHNVTCRFYRKQRGARVPLEGAEVDAKLSYQPRAEGRIDASRAIARCDAALIRNRPAEHQRIFKLFYGGGRPMRVIAHNMGRPTESVKDSLRRSRDLLLRDVPELQQTLQAARA